MPGPHLTDEEACIEDSPIIRGVPSYRLQMLIPSMGNQVNARNSKKKVWTEVTCCSGTSVHLCEEILHSTAEKKVGP